MMVLWQPWSCWISKRCMFCFANIKTGSTFKHFTQTYVLLWALWRQGYSLKHFEQTVMCCKTNWTWPIHMLPIQHKHTNQKNHHLVRDASYQFWSCMLLLGLIFGCLDLSLIVCAGGQASGHVLGWMDLYFRWYLCLERYILSWQSILNERSVYGSECSSVNGTTNRII